MEQALSLDKTAEQHAEAALIRRLAWRIVPLLAVCWVVNWIDRINIGFALFGFQKSLNVSNAEIGLIIGIYSIGYLLFEVPSNLVMERIGARRTLTRIMLLWGLITIATAFARNGTDLIIARLALGAAEAGFSQRWAETIAGYSPVAVQATMRLAKASQAASLASARQEIEATREWVQSQDDYRQGAAAFAKRS